MKAPSLVPLQGWQLAQLSPAQLLETLEGLLELQARGLLPTPPPESEPVPILSREQLAQLSTEQLEALIRWLEAQETEEAEP
jgi:hypothetical protein